jgi:hypothetical protein
MDHHVYFWLTEEKNNPSDRAVFEQALTALFEVPLVTGGRWAVPAKVEIRPVVDQSWDYAISMRFATLEDHNLYQDHPLHSAFIQSHKDWWAKVRVSDLA